MGSNDNPDPAMYYILDEAGRPQPVARLGEADKTQLAAWADWMAENKFQRWHKKTEIGAASVITVFQGIDEAVALLLDWGPGPWVFGTLTTVAGGGEVREHFDSTWDKALEYHESEVNRLREAK